MNVVFTFRFSCKRLKRCLYNGFNTHYLFDKHKTSTTVRDAANISSNYLKLYNIEDADLSVQYLISHIKNLGYRQSDYYNNLELIVKITKN